jgi:hypothetical protein
MPPSSWKDYSASGNGNGHHTNHAYEPFEADPRGMPPLPPGAPRGGHGGHPHHHHPQMPSHPNGSLQKPRPSAGSYSRSYTQQHSAPAGPGYSLPRHTNGGSHPNGTGGYGGLPPPPPPGYGSYDRRGYHGRPSEFPPDHYFMPSQRKYSGEVVRVFVDYNNK